jgi:Rrf2 family protein
MKLSMKSEYGVRATLDLAERHGQGAIASSEIAARQQIPSAFLDQVLMALRKAGLVRSIRGPRGGHLLSRAPDQVTLAQVIAALEGPPATVDCDAHPATLACVWHRASHRADGAVRQVLEAQSLEALLREQREGRPVYHGIFKPLARAGRR